MVIRYFEFPPAGQDDRQPPAWRLKHNRFLSRVDLLCQRQAKAYLT
jgi:hypothetical protein